MTGVLFLSQNNLNTWLESGKVDMGQDSLIFTDDKSSHPIVSAVHFTSILDGPDAQKLLGKVKAVEALRMGGAEVSMGSVIVGETGYQVEEGFMVTVQMADRPSARPPSRANVKPSGQEADLLAQFILNKLS